MVPETFTLVLIPSLPLTSLPLIVTENGALLGALRLAVIFRAAEPPFEPMELVLRLAFTPRGSWLVPMVRLTGLFVVPLATSLAVIETEAFDPLLTVIPEGAVSVN